MIVEIDDNSGFCFGVVEAINKAESELLHGELYCIGDILHNDIEVERLKQKGLITIDHNYFSSLKNSKVLFRAHGEPPTSYTIAKENNIEIIDATCPVVLKLQNRIKNTYKILKQTNGQIVIYGKPKHAEVIGLVGQTNGEAIVIENDDDLSKIDYNRDIALFSQTTKSLNGFNKLAHIIKEKCTQSVKIYDTICRKVENRIPQLKDFAKCYELIIFVSGKKSSNGKQLFSVCQDSNPNSYFIESADEIKKEIFKGYKNIGISGATSTPRWIMEEIKNKIEKIFQENI